MKIKPYLRRFKQHLHGRNNGIAGGRVERIVTDSFIKQFFEFVLCFFAKPICVIAEKKTWRHNNIDFERKRLLKRVDDSGFIVSPLVKVMINFGFILADNDTPYYGIYRNFVHEIQRWERLDRVDLSFHNLTEDAQIVKESEVFNRTIQHLVKKHGVTNADLVKDIERYKKVKKHG